MKVRGSRSIGKAHEYEGAMGCKHQDIQEEEEPININVSYN